MIVDFQQHYTPPELLQERDGITVRVDENGNPNYLLNPLLADLGAHIRMMDRAGIDAGVLSCGAGFDQPDIALCRLINDRIKQAVDDHPGRFIGLAHVPALNPAEAMSELKRCAVELGFPGAVIASELQGLPLDHENLRPFWRSAADLGLYVFIHPLPRVIAWEHIYADDLGRMLGWQFSLMIAAVRVINSGLLDELPSLRIQFSHFAAGLGRYLGRIRGFQQRDKWGTAALGQHNRGPRLPFDHYLEHRLFYDCAGWAGPDHAAEWGAEWVGFGLQEVALSQIVFATDYPQAVRDAEEVAAYVAAVRALGPNARAMVHGLAADRLVPDLSQRLARRRT
ncbi:MAG TPA: amidohydrolase family protein [Xanthobacteraceae bacterium]|nr:amidohydrolase family protein [Xanthobacteraceae bacterium]